MSQRVQPSGNQYNSYQQQQNQNSSPMAASPSSPLNASSEAPLSPTASRSLAAVGGGWSPVTIYCATQRFQTTTETLLQFPNTQLHRLFSPPYPLYDAHNEAHMLPAGLCPDPAIFHCILEFLRTGHWTLSPTDDALYEAVCATAAALQIPSQPPQLLRMGTNTFRYEHQIVQLPVPFEGSPQRNNSTNANTSGPRGGQGAAGGKLSSNTLGSVKAPTSGSNPSSASQSPRRPVSPPPPYDPNLNTASMLSLLGFKGFTVVAEAKGASKFTTEVTLRRKLPCVKGVELLAEESMLFQQLLNIA